MHSLDPSWLRRLIFPRKTHRERVFKSWNQGSNGAIKVNDQHTRRVWSRTCKAIVEKVRKCKQSLRLLERGTQSDNSRFSWQTVYNGGMNNQHSRDVGFGGTKMVKPNRREDQRCFFLFKDCHARLLRNSRQVWIINQVMRIESRVIVTYDYDFCVSSRRFVNSLSCDRATFVQV